MSKDDVIRQLVDAIRYAEDGLDEYWSEHNNIFKTRSAIAAGEAELAKHEPEPVANINCYIQHVPDHCDRIIWKGMYYHLPIKQSIFIPEGWKLVPTRIDNNMIDAANNVPEGIFGTQPHWQWVWDAMISSAPDYKGVRNESFIR